MRLFFGASGLFFVPTGGVICRHFESLVSDRFKVQRFGPQRTLMPVKWLMTQEDRPGFLGIQQPDDLLARCRPLLRPNLLHHPVAASHLS